MFTSSSTIVQRLWNYCNVLRDERLGQAILRQAFEGKLVPQDPSDEPAGVLLERIRAQRESVSNEAQSARRFKKVVPTQTDAQERVGRLEQCSFLLND